MDPFLISAFLDGHENEKKQIMLTSKQLVVIYKGKSEIFSIDKVLHFGLAKKKLIIPLVAGGIGTSLSMIALSMGWYNYYINVVLIFFFFGTMYYGFLGSDAIEVTEKGQNHVFLLNVITHEIREFVKFYYKKKSTYLNSSGQYIYHLANPGCWEKQKLSMVYKPDEYEKDGFIHASDYHQVRSTYERYYESSEMYLLCIDVRYLKPEVKYESADHSAESFPHIYGFLNKESIVEIVNIRGSEDVSDNKISFTYTYKE